MTDSLREMPVAALVLAAGRSSRMGEHKLLLPLGGRPLISYAVEAACASRANPIFVILGYQAEAVRAVLPPGRYTVSINQAFASGMASSLRKGIVQLTTLESPIAGAIILLADQPLVNANIINQILTAASKRPTAIIAATYAGTRSTPVYFPRSLFDEILHIEGDEGGRSVIANHLALLQLEVIEDSEAGVDIDQPGEYEQLRARKNDYSANRG